LPDHSNLDILEAKIGEAIERLSAMKDENLALRKKNDELKRHAAKLDGVNESLQKQIREFEGQVKVSRGNGADLEAIRDRVDGILSKFDLLDL